MDLSFIHQSLIVALALGVVLPLAQWAISGADADAMVGYPFDTSLARAVFCLIATVVIPTIAVVVTAMTHPLGSVLFFFTTAVTIVTAGDLGPTHCLLFGALVSGHVLALGMARGIREIPLHVIGLFTLVAVSIGLALLIGWSQGEEMWQRLEEIPAHIIRSSFEMNLAALEALDEPAPHISPREQKRLLDLSTWIFPGRVLVFQFFLLFFAMRLTRRALPGGAGKMQPLWSLTSGEPLAALVVVMGLGTLVCSEMGWPIAERIADNALLVLYHMLWLVGLSIAHCLMLQMRLSTPLRIWGWVLLILLSVQQGPTSLMRMLLAGLGLFDVWFNFRRRGARWAAARRRGPKS